MPLESQSPIIPYVTTYRRSQSGFRCPTYLALIPLEMHMFPRFPMPRLLRLRAPHQGSTAILHQYCQLPESCEFLLFLLSQGGMLEVSARGQVKRKESPCQVFTGVRWVWVGPKMGEVPKTGGCSFGVPLRQPQGTCW